MTQDILDIQRVLVPILADSDVRTAAIFGSRVKGVSTDKSDVDLLVSFERPISLFKVVALERLLAEALGCHVDLVSENSVSPYLKEEIVHTSVPIYEK
jgi:predicted nucleotidyltransferase